MAPSSARGKVTVDLEVFADALDHLEVEVVQSGSTGDEILSAFDAHSRPYPLVAGQMIVIQPWPPLSSRPIQSPNSWPLLV